MQEIREIEVKKVVRERYAGAARGGSTCCGDTGGADLMSRQIGYSDEDLSTVPAGANMGLGCGNPVALASLEEGETILDLGSGGGFDCFLAARKVGDRGKVIGVDMTPEMIARARENALKGHYRNVEFRLGEIESLPVADGSIDAVISNCVINLSPHKRRVFSEVFRVLKPGGRMMVSDIVLLEPLPDAVRTSVEAYVGCIAGASLKDEYIEDIRAAGFQDIRVCSETPYPIDCVEDNPAVQAILKSQDLSLDRLRRLAEGIVSVSIQAVKPAP
jgi:SAM-dependent methyltransferase